MEDSGGERDHGFTRSRIVSLIIGESLTVALAGGMLGSIAAYAILRVGEVGRDILGPFGPIRMSMQVAVYAVAAAAAVGLLSGIGPAISAVRRGVAESLRAII